MSLPPVVSGVETLQLIHDSADVLDAVGEFHSKSFLDDPHEGVAVHHGGEVVEPVGEGEGLWIGVSLPHLLYAAVDVSEVRIDALDFFAVENGLQPEHSVSRGVLRTDIDHIVVLIEETMLGAHQFAGVVEGISVGVFAFLIVLQGVGVVELPVFPEGMTLEIVSQEQPLHDGVSEELDAIEVEDFPFEEVGGLPDVDDGRDDVVFVHLLGDGFHAGALMVGGAFQNIDASQSFLAEVFSHDGDKVVVMLLFLQLFHFLAEVVKRNVDEF